MSTRLRWILLAALVCAPVPAAADGLSAADGKSLAQQYCVACHRVTQEQAMPPNVVVDTGSGPEEFEAPSFARIAARTDRSEADLRQRILTPHYPMREQQFVPGELEAIVAYILSLRSGGAAAGW